MHELSDNVYPVSQTEHKNGDVHCKQLVPQGLHLNDEI